ncbi:MAG: FAD-dependent oxidoreductase [Micrococcaceae bacterium]
MSKVRVAVIGSGPAGVYAADILAKADKDFEVSIDLFDRYPAPFGLIRYGVAPDHPRIKGIIMALHKVMDRGDIRFFGNVDYGKDITLEDLQKHYHAVIFATGAVKDAAIDIPGADLEGSYGAADFVSWFDGHPDVSRTWDLNAKEIAVLGNGNVALDVSRILAKHADDLLTTEIPDNVYEGLKKSPVTDVHVFGRRGPAQIKFTPLELRELGKVNDVDIVLYPEDFDLDESDMAEIESNNQTKVMMKTLQNWLIDDEGTGASRRLHLHFLHNPVEIKGEYGKVTGIKFERNKLVGNGQVEGTGEFIEYPVQAVYRAIGYFGSELDQIPFDGKRGVIQNEEGRIVDDEGKPLSGLYATGWIKRGPVGLIGHTKSDAMETIKHFIEDEPNFEAPVEDADFAKVLEDKDIHYTTWDGWLALDDYERELGKSYEGVKRERIKVVPREDMVEISRKTS